jgi:multicomponent Na+:H+ antiporter subunit C
MRRYWEKRMLELIFSKANYWIYIVLIMVGFYGMMAKNNLMKKLIGMNIFQWAIILYYISIGAKKGGTIPVIMGPQGAGSQAVRAADYINPLEEDKIIEALKK